MARRDAVLGRASSPRKKEGLMSGTHLSMRERRGRVPIRLGARAGRGTFLWLGQTVAPRPPFFCFFFFLFCFLVCFKTFSK
jgi:hypothetical protein